LHSLEAHPLPDRKDFTSQMGYSDSFLNKILTAPNVMLSFNESQITHMSSQ
jgi:hypothetical protein